LRVGFETAEWAYDRDDVLEQVEHSRAIIAESFPARSGFPPRSHEGHTYLASWAGLDGTRVTAARIEPALPEAHVRVEKVRFISQDGTELLLSQSAGVGNHRIIYRSEDAVIYENPDAFPRAWWVSGNQVRAVGDGLMLVEGIVPEDVIPAKVVSDEGTTLAMRVDARSDGYLVLADLYYPGWRACLEGEDRAILRFEKVFRAIQVPAGSHEIAFRYEPLCGILSRLVAQKRAP